MKNNGINNEYAFIKKINNKRVNELSFLLQELIYMLFPKINNNSMIKCFKNKKYEKSDICIKVGIKYKYISIKNGFNNSVHSESIHSFITFLIKNRISLNVINEILKYHYADGTFNGSGQFRIAVKEYKIYNKS